MSLIERLREKVHRGRYMPGGGTIDAKGKGTMWGGEKIMEYRNPDGPKAATQLEAMQAELGAVLDMVDEIYRKYGVELWPEDVVIAQRARASLDRQGK